MAHELVKNAQERMAKSVEAIRDDLSKIRTGKASASLLDPVKVDAYGSEMPLNQVSTVSTPDARLITVQPWDKGLLNSIEKAILKADLGFNPSNDGVIIRIPVPPLNEDRRKEFVKMCRKITEDGRIAIRNVRRDGNDHLKKLEKEHAISEDELHNYIDDVQQATDKFIKELDQILKHKEAEILEV